MAGKRARVHHFEEFLEDENGELVALVGVLRQQDDGACGVDCYGLERIGVVDGARKVTVVFSISISRFSNSCCIRGRLRDDMTVIRRHSSFG